MNCKGDTMVPTQNIILTVQFDDDRKNISKFLETKRF